MLLLFIVKISRVSDTKCEEYCDNSSRQKKYSIRLLSRDVI